MSWNVWNRPSGSFMVDMGISSNIMKSPLPNVTWHSGTWHIQWHLFANLLPNWTLIPILTLLPNFGGFHRTLQRVRLANRGRLLLRTPGPVPFGTCICSNVETILSWTCHVYGPFEFRTSLGTSQWECQEQSAREPLFGRTYFRHSSPLLRGILFLSWTFFHFRFLLTEKWWFLSL